MKASDATVGVSDHGGWAILVTLGPLGNVLDRCRVELKDSALPGLPHHCEGQRLELPDAVSLVERVRLSARRHSCVALEALDQRLGCPIGRIALRAIPNLPPSVVERISNRWANARADGVMFREELAEAARARDWIVGWFDTRSLDSILQSPDFVEAEAEARRRLAPPWNNDCRLALAGAFAARLNEE